MAPFIWGSSSAQDAVADDSIQIEYLAPESPGDDFFLAYEVPQGCVSAIIIMGHANANEPSWEDYTSAIAIPIPSDPATGLAIIQGKVPETTDAGLLSESTLEFRIAILDPVTLVLQLSLPTPLVPKSEPSDTDLPDDAGFASPNISDLVSQVADVSVLDDSDLEDMDLGDLDSEGDGPEDDSEKSTQNSPGAGKLSKIGNSSNVISTSRTLVLLTSSDFIYHVHDQPTPIHGSGH